MAPLYNPVTAGGTVSADVVDSAAIIDGSITAFDLAPDCVDADALATGSVTPDALAADAVTSAALATGSVTPDALAADAVTSAAIATGAVTSDALASGAVTSAAVAAGAVTSAALAADAVTSAAIATGAVTSTALAAGAVTSTALAAGAVTSTALAAGAVTSTALAADAVTSTALTAGAVTSTALAADAVTSAAIATGAVTSDALASGAVTSAAVASGVVAKDKLSTQVAAQVDTWVEWETVTTPALTASYGTTYTTDVVGYLGATMTLPAISSGTTYYGARVGLSNYGQYPIRVLGSFFMTADAWVSPGEHATFVRGGSSWRMFRHGCATAGRLDSWTGQTWGPGYVVAPGGPGPWSDGMKTVGPLAGNIHVYGFCAPMAVGVSQVSLYVAETTASACTVRVGLFNGREVGSNGLGTGKVALPGELMGQGTITIPSGTAAGFVSYTPSTAWRVNAGANVVAFSVDSGSSPSFAAINTERRDILAVPSTSLNLYGTTAYATWTVGAAFSGWVPELAQLYRNDGAWPLQWFTLVD